MEINREKILNRIDDLQISPTYFQRLCGGDGFGIIAPWLGHRFDELPPLVEKRVAEVFLLIEQIILEMGEMSPGELGAEVEKRSPAGRPLESTAQRITEKDCTGGQ